MIPEGMIYGGTALEDNMTRIISGALLLFLISIMSKQFIIPIMSVRRDTIPV